MKALLLAGGIGSRLFPVTLGVSKQLLPVYDKPMIYYPLSVLMQAGIQEIMLISTPGDINLYQRLLGDGSQWGIKFIYKIQPKPNGLAQAFILGEDFIDQDPICLILGDNIFYGLDFAAQLKGIVKRTKKNQKATIFGYKVKNPQNYGVLEFDIYGKPVNIEEKPIQPKSKQAVVGLYFYPNKVIEVAKKCSPSSRGELEITSVNQAFLENNELIVEPLQNGFTWLDTGTHESLLEAGQFIKTIEKRQGIKIGCLEEVAYQQEFIDKKQLLKQAHRIKGATYADYLLERYA